MRIGINGFGRIGKLVARALLTRQRSCTLVAINDLLSAERLAHALTYDSSYGRFTKPVHATDGKLELDGAHVAVSAEREVSAIPWRTAGVELVIDCTGRHTDGAAARQHLAAAGPRKVIVSAPMQGEDLTVVLGVNEQAYEPARHHVLSNASCTTNALACVVKPLSEAFGWQHGLMTTTHAYTNDQSLLDGPHKDLRRSRAAGQNIVPTSSGAAKALHLVVPATKGRFDGFALRVPSPSVSFFTLCAVLDAPVSVERANAALLAASQSAPLHGRLSFSDVPLVSQDYRGDPHSATVDSALTQSAGPLLSVSAWYDNEWAYACRLAELTELVATRA